MDQNANDAEVRRFIDLLNEREAAVASIGPCSLADYRAYVGHLPRSSEEQIGNFVRFVSSAHSWYKHLPLLPPGEPFTFFVDPYAGYDRVVLRGGGVVHEERTDQSQRFHYTWMTTQEYRTRFGHLAYESGAGCSFFVQSGATVREYAESPIFSTDEGAYRIPAEAREAGTVELTGVIHPKTPRAEVWGGLFCRRDRDPSEAQRKWPSETGGDETLSKIQAALSRWSYLAWEEAEEQLYALIMPERRRLQEEMANAIRRVLALLYG